MKVLYHHRTASKDGQDVHIEEMIAAMRAAGHEVIVVAPKAADQSSFGHDGGMAARLKRLLPGPVYELMELAYSVPAFWRLFKAYRAYRPELLYERYNLFFLSGLWLKRWTGIPYLLEINSPLAYERGTYGGLKLKGLANLCERAVWRGADYTLPVTGVLARFVRDAGVAERRIVVVPNGINRQRFPAGADGTQIRKTLGLEGRVILGFTGFIREWHGLEHVVDAMASMENRESLHLLLVGDGPAREGIEAHARRRGMAGKVTCVGLVERDEVARYVAAFDIALQPKVVSYASPLKLFEYMGLGRAIIAPDQENIREVLVHEENALLFRQDDMEDFGRQVMRLCGDPALRTRLGRAAAQSIEKRGLTWETNAHRVLTLAAELKRG